MRTNIAYAADPEAYGHEPEFGSVLSDDRLPLVRLREHRRELVLSLQGAVTRDRIREIAEVQQAIKAIEAVIAE